MNLLSTLRGALRPKSDLALALDELESAKRQRLQAQSGQEFATAMVAYHTSRIERLRTYIEAQHARGGSDE